jgi:hypothetical protein
MPWRHPFGVGCDSLVTSSGGWVKSKCKPKLPPPCDGHEEIAQAAIAPQPALAVCLSRVKQAIPSSSDIALRFALQRQMSDDVNGACFLSELTDVKASVKLKRMYFSRFILLVLW